MHLVLGCIVYSWFIVILVFCILVHFNLSQNQINMQKHFYKIDDDSKTITIYCTIHSYVVMYAVF